MKIIIAFGIIFFIVPEVETHAYSNPITFYFEDVDEDQNEIAGEIVYYQDAEFYFLNKENEKVGEIPVEKSTNNRSFIPTNTKLPVGALRIGAFGVREFDRDILYGVAPIFDGAWHSFVGDVTFYDTDLSKGGYGGYIEWTGPEYKGNLHGYEITVRQGDQKRDETLAIVPVNEGTTYRYELPSNTKIDDFKSAVIYGRNEIGDPTPAGMGFTMLDRYEINLLSKGIADLGERINVTVYNSPQSSKYNSVFLSTYSDEGRQNTQYSSLVAILDENENVISFVGELNEMNFFYKFPKDFPFPATSKYIGVYWKSHATGEIIGKSIKKLPDDLVSPPGNVEPISKPLQSSQVTIRPAGIHQYFVEVTNLPQDSELKVYGDQKNLLHSAIITAESYTKLLKVNDSQINQLQFSIVEKGSLESNPLSVAINSSKWIYLEEEINIPTNKEWVIKFNESVNLQDLTNEKIYILDSNGEKVPVHISGNIDYTNLTLQLKKPFENGHTYYIYVEDSVRNQSNQALGHGYIKKFIIQP
ncbi:Ig-like domain-containing protein [Solibacillus sp. FSL W7-1464]|uniref:Ig-like domain-containing protein n=1 Tax=Solibacillus sp. FSL W7-1464 TaxID=2921706 RepID=UPI0030FABE06